MLLTLVVCYYARPIVCHPVRRKKAVSMLLIALSIPLGATTQRPALAEYRLGEAGQGMLGDSAQPPQEAHEQVSLFGRQQKLREGTVIPPTVGRVVNLGRRWAFVPLDERGIAHREYALEENTSDARPLSTLPLSTLSRVANDNDAIAINRGISLGWESNPRLPQSWSEPGPDAPSGSRENQRRASEGQHIILCENQMLQRIVEATRADANDDRWEISGEILEFFDQNRLLIRTIQRAGSN